MPDRYEYAAPDTLQGIANRLDRIERLASAIVSALGIPPVTTGSHSHGPIPWTPETHAHLNYGGPETLMHAIAQIKQDVQGIKTSAPEPSPHVHTYDPPQSVREIQARLTAPLPIPPWPGGAEAHNPLIAYFPYSRGDEGKSST